MIEESQSKPKRRNVLKKIGVATSLTGITTISASQPVAAGDRKTVTITETEGAKARYYLEIHDCYMKSDDEDVTCRDADGDGSCDYCWVEGYVNGNSDTVTIPDHSFIAYCELEDQSGSYVLPKVIIDIEDNDNYDTRNLTISGDGNNDGEYKCKCTDHFEKDEGRCGLESNDDWCSGFESACIEGGVTNGDDCWEMYGQFTRIMGSPDGSGTISYTMDSF